MALIEPGPLHRVALAVEDASAANEWFEQVLGVSSLGPERQAAPGELGAAASEDDLEGTDTRIFRLGGFPFILLSKGAPGGPVSNFLSRWGPGVHSLAWEVDDMWTVQNLLIRSGVRIGAVNIPGRHFFMHPRDTHGVLMEWTDDSFDPAGWREGRDGVIDLDGLAWVTAAVADAAATADFLAGLCGATVVNGNAQGASDRELTIDVNIGDATVRLVTPRSPASRYAGVLSDAPRLCSFALRVPDLDTALKALAAEGVPTIAREGDLAVTDPSATFGVPIEWTT